jgi:hypothetical protein
MTAFLAVGIHLCGPGFSQSHHAGLIENAANRIARNDSARPERFIRVTVARDGSPLHDGGAATCC